ncbi:Response regulator receiver domain-containing protein [Mariniphaga anaerophila]|uniref:Response regulator receiver domain-containing protein n=1 Tax=Mariniphaga anaerophila TaxID=1484053 RepID=A0A1M5CS45_9BACT|nr:bifunctional response regulator/alkaline phosphatase family protein [Mariniphaga anaerophila]SHF57573.1 Response regulator receiver domain-containing protein [Mariniphaga anaerophila]
MRKPRILWVDDEIDVLRAHIIFLESKDYEVETANNGLDAIEMVKKSFFDIIFLDENMPGMTGLETLNEIKTVSPNVPVVMITKSEEENIMDEAIGSKIADYLIKPVNPKQILLTLKKNIDQKRLVTQQTTSAYQTQFSQIGMRINDRLNYQEWFDIYKKLVFWEIELSTSEDGAMDEVLAMQKNDANKAFFKFIKENYLEWLNKDYGERPLLSYDIFHHKIFPLLDAGKKVFVLVIDNLRFDQWRTISPVFEEYFRVDSDELYMSILPTATMYARNAIFAGLMPAEIEKVYPDLWDDDDNEGNKNRHEEELLRKQLERHRRKEKLYFEKVSGIRRDSQISESLKSIAENDLSVMVFNFVDMISHARTEMEMIRELAKDEKAYRSLTLSWFNHSSLRELIKNLAGNNINLVVTTDHGTIRVDNPVKVIGDRETNTNLRYKLGKNLNYKSKNVFEVRDPRLAYLPSRNVSTSYIFTHGSDFFAYPNNYNYYANYYKDTFQHGGISLEEMIVPLITLVPKG